MQIDARLLTGKVKWNVSTNISINRNKVVNLGGLDDILSTSERAFRPVPHYQGGLSYRVVLRLYKAVGVMSELDYRNAESPGSLSGPMATNSPPATHCESPAVARYALDDLSTAIRSGRRERRWGHRHELIKRFWAMLILISGGFDQPLMERVRSLGARLHLLIWRLSDKFPGLLLCSIWKVLRISMRSRPTVMCRT